MPRHLGQRTVVVSGPACACALAESDKRYVHLHPRPDYRLSCERHAGRRAPTGTSRGLAPRVADHAQANGGRLDLPEVARGRGNYGTRPSRSSGSLSPLISSVNTGPFGALRRRSRHKGLVLLVPGSFRSLHGRDYLRCRDHHDGDRDQQVASDDAVELPLIQQAAGSYEPADLSAV